MIKDIRQDAEALIRRCGGELQPADRYTDMKYLKFLPIMRFHVDRYRLGDFGQVMLMHTTTKMGMELITMSFMPASGAELPYLLIDAMSMKKKRCVFVEYYGCGHEGFEDDGLKNVFEEYKGLPDYEENDNWYIRERMPYSLIKTGGEKDLAGMAGESVRAYLEAAQKADRDPGYKAQLKAFRERMIVEGNPSSKTLNMLLGKDGARFFTENVIMPLWEDT